MAVMMTATWICPELFFSNPGGKNPPGEGPAKVASATGKWCDSNFRSCGRSILLLEMLGKSVVEATHIRLRTSSDNPGRDPAELVVEGLFAGGGDTWLPLFDGGASGEDGACLLPAERKAWSDWLPLRVPSTQALKAPAREGQASDAVAREGAEDGPRGASTAGRGKATTKAKAKA